MRIQTSEIQHQKKINGLDFPLVVTPPEDIKPDDGAAFSEWLTESSAALRELLISHGAVLFRGFPVDTPDHFEKMLEEAGFVNMPYIGGAAPREKVTEGRIVTANESPATEKIPFHHEMAQVPKPPGYIFFYCDTPAKSGGATSILHSGEVYELLMSIAPDFADKLEKQGVRYIRVMPEETDNSSAIGRSWKETFQVDSREAAETVMKDAGMSWEWLEDGSLRTETATLPAIRMDEETGQKVFFNAIVAVYTGWNDSRNTGTRAVKTGDGEYLDDSIITRLQQEMDKACVNFPWQNGDVLWVNNHTVLHAREPFEGKRRILASISVK